MPEPSITEPVMNRPAPAAPPLSIGFYARTWPVGQVPNGILTYLNIITEAMERAGHRTTIVAASKGEGLQGDGVYSLQEERKRITRHPLPRVLYGLWYRLGADAPNRHLQRRALRTAFERALGERALDVFEMEESFGWAHWLRGVSRVPVCVRLHGPWFLNGRALGVPEDGQFRRRVEAERRAIVEADGITAPSRDVLDQTRDYYGLELKHAEVIPIPAPRVREHWRLDGADPKRIAFVGRFDRHKGGDLMIDAFARVLRAVPDARLWFVGPDRGVRDDDGRTWTIEEYARSRLPGSLAPKQFEWLGLQPPSAVSELRLRAMVSVACSRYENFPLTVLEAMAMGCPLVAARVGGIPEVLDDGKNGLLHEAGDPEDLAARIVDLLKNPGQAAQLGRQAAIDSQLRLSREAIAARTVEFYRRLMARSE
jgi:glycosyltransferase involved in cell wall biosynthesis